MHGVLVVDTTADSGPGSLREAIQGAQGGSVIGFATNVFPGTITLKSNLPPLATDNIIIQGGRAVTIDGSGLKDSVFSLRATCLGLMGLTFNDVEVVTEPSCMGSFIYGNVFTGKGHAYTYRGSNTVCLFPQRTFREGESLR